MAYLIGTDEAGYGPNLGPLVVSASLWRVSDDLVDADFYDLLRDSICRKPVDAKNGRIAIADSKDLFKQGGGLATLEEGLYPAMRQSGQDVTDWTSLWNALANISQFTSPWYVDHNPELPGSASTEKITLNAETLQSTLAAAKVELLALRSRVVFPTEFNQQVEVLGNKASLLSHTTLKLAADLMAPLGDEPILLHCDKHGGRNKYAAFLQEIFPDGWVQVLRETRESSEYQWGSPPRRITARFVAKGEGFLPSALASMACKYLRELSMDAFNKYWRGQLPGLKATAGYPQDAKRFKRDISAVQQQLGVQDNDLWRCR